MKYSKKTIKYVSLISLAALLFGGLSTISFTNKNAAEVSAIKAAPTITYTNQDAETYYPSNLESLSGNDLLTALRNLNKEKRQTTIGYSSMSPNSPSDDYEYTDYDPTTVQYDANNQPYGTKLLSFYSGKSVSSGMNREHVWPNTHGGNKVEADIHMPRPTITTENGSRSHSFYIEGYKTNNGGGWDPAMESFGLESYRGDSARIIFYCMVASSDLKLVDDKTRSSLTSNNEMGIISDMLSWNLRYPVLERERNRNEGAEYLQGNRNPFIDHPEYACKIWGTFNDATRAICSGSVAESITISKSEVTLYEGKTTTIYATSSDSSEITWTSNDENVVNVSSEKAQSGVSITLTAGSAGTATVTASATIDNVEYSALCTVTVKAESASGSSEYVKYSGDITEGNYLITYSNKAMNTTVSSNRLQYTEVNPQNDTIENPDDSIIWHIAKDGNDWTLFNAADNVYAASTSSNNQATTVSEVTNNAKWTVSGNDTYEFVNNANNRYLRENGTYGYGCYATSTGGALTLYKQNSATPSKTLESIAVKTSPKVSYTAGETFNPAGLVLTATYDDDSTEDISYASEGDKFSFVPSTSTALTTSMTSVAITFGGKSVNLPITVSPAKTLSSISISGYKTEFEVGDEFEFGGTVTATYTDYSVSDVTSASEFSGYDMSTAGVQTVTVSYSEGNADLEKTYQITVTEPVATEIAATLINPKTYHPGESISKSDIKVMDDLGNVITDYTFETYQFTYKDAPSGGSVGQKELTITYGDLSTTLSVSVSRNPRESTNVVTDSITASDLVATDTNYKSFTNVTKLSGVKYAGNSAKDASGNIQLRSRNSNSGIVSTSSSSNVKSVKITVGSGNNTINVYGSNKVYTSAADLFDTNKQGTLVGSLSATGTITFTDSYLYVGIRSNSGAVYLSKVEITYGAEDTAINLANYIMFEDTNGQCNTKFDIAKGYFEGLSKSERTTFMTSEAYVISTAKTRFEAWASAKGNIVELNNGDYIVTNGLGSLNRASTNSNLYLVIVASIALVSVSSIVVVIIIKKKMYH